MRELAGRGHQEGPLVSYFKTTQLKFPGKRFQHGVNFSALRFLGLLGGFLCDLAPVVV